MTEYIVRAQNANGNGFSQSYSSQSDAMIAVTAIKKANECLNDGMKFHGWVTLWKGYEDITGKVTTSADTVNSLNF